VAAHREDKYKKRVKDKRYNKGTREKVGLERKSDLREKGLERKRRS